MMVLLMQTTLVASAYKAGLVIADYRLDPVEYLQFYMLGVDGVLSDFGVPHAGSATALTAIFIHSKPAWSIDPVISADQENEECRFTTATRRPPTRS
jgi:hypothetical protein